MNDVHFSRQTNFTGRNGYMKCSGINLLRQENSVLLAPLTSRGCIGRCDVEIPLEDLPALIAGLQALLPKCLVQR